MIYEKELKNFLLENGKTTEGYTLNDIYSFSRKSLEFNHCYIQWLFPTNEKSRYNKYAPIITNKLLIENKEIQKVILNNFLYILKFYGLFYENNQVKQDKSYLWLILHWINPLNHNFKRITRIMKCLLLFSLEKESKAFYNYLKELPFICKIFIGLRSYMYWTNVFSKYN